MLVAEDGHHSRLGASGYWRWSKCPGSVALIDKVLANGGGGKSSVAAAEGTAAHLLGSTCLSRTEDAPLYLGDEVVVESRTFTVDQEMVDGVQEYVDYVREYALVNGGQIYVEHGMASVLDPEAHGTADAAIVCPERLGIADLKYGRKIVVEPDAGQLKYYAYLVVEEFGPFPDDFPMDLVISQPRIPHPRGTTRTHTTTAGEVTAWFHDEVLPAMEATRREDAPLAIGDWCRFCPARDECPALHHAALTLPVETDPAHLTDEELGDLLTRRNAVSGYFDSLEKEGYRRAMNGAAIPGSKLVRERKNRVWKDDAEEAIKRKLGDAAYSEPKLLGPAAIEKLAGGKALVARWAFTPTGGLTLVRDSDKREAVVVSPEYLFGDARRSKPTAN